MTNWRRGLQEHFDFVLIRRSHVIMAMNSDIPAVPHFDCHGDVTSVGPRWKRWLKAFTYYVDGRGITNPAQQKALLLHSAGMEVQEIFETLEDGNAPEEENDNVYKQTVRKLNAYFTPQLNVPYERHVFRKMTQQDDETVDQYVSRLKRQAVNCEFGNRDAVNEQVRDQVIDCCKSSSLRRKLLQKGADLSLDTVLDTARALEAVDIQSKRMEGKSGEVNLVKSEKTQKPAAATGKSCFRCGRIGHFAKDPKCPADKATCRRCGSVGHFAVVCKTKDKKKISEVKPNGNPRRMKNHPGSVNNVERENSDDEEYVFSLRNAKTNHSGVVTVKVGGVFMEVLIDSGSSMNVIDRDTWESLKKQRIRCVSERLTKQLYAYGSREPLETIGKFAAKVEIGARQTDADFIVIKGEGRSLLSKSTAEQLGVLKIGLNVNAVGVSDEPKTLTADDIQKRFPEVCSGIGKLKDYQAKIHVDPNVKPVAQSSRRVPFALRDKLEMEIQRLLKDDIIEPVEGPTPWVSPLVIIPKQSGDIRVCVDMRTANTAVIRERYMIPTVDEVIQRMSGSTVFSKIDLKCGYHQLEVEEQSRSITTFACHLGIFRYKRLIFGISSAPELFQHVVQQALAGCEGVENISDDLIVHGNGTVEHDERLFKVLETLRQKGLTINLPKCAFRLPELEYVGHVMNGNSIAPTSDHVKAVVEARQAESIREVRSFMGLLNFSAKVIPNMATVAEPLRELTRKGTPFRWGKKQETAFQKLKDELSNAVKLAHFVKGAETEIVVDASPVGLGAMLVQKQDGVKRVISYASRSLSRVERRYSQTEKEALGIVWACEKFHAYLYGIHFEIVTHHKPLVYIYSPKSKPCARVERWVLRLQSYDFSVRHIPGTEMPGCIVTLSEGV